MRKRFTLKDDKSSFTATMDSRLLEPAPIIHIEFSDFNTEKHYRLPHFFKYVAWIYSRFIILVIIMSSCTVITIYGEYFSRVKTYVWTAAFLLSFVFSTILLEPARILLMAVVKSLVLRKNVVIEKRKISPSLVWNPENPEKKRKVLNLRQYNAKLYSPTPLTKLQNRLDDIKYQLEMKSIVLNFLINVLFFWFNVIILYAPLSNNAYYNNNAVVETFVNARYTHSINLSSVETYKSLMKYLNESFLPALLPDFVNDSEAIHRRKRSKRRERSWDSTAKQRKPLPDRFTETQQPNYFHKISDDEESVILSETGWTINRNVKVMGKARIRQVRVRSDYCKEYKHLKTRNVECPPELNLLNVETRNFSLSWKLEPSRGLTEHQELPWKYQSAWKTSTLPVLTRMRLYPGGGYILEVPKNIDDARIVLEYMDTLQWVDMRTRALFIEFTLYCVNTNYFDVVTLIFERSATGYFIPSYRIDTCNFLLEISIYVGVYSGICCAILIIILLREFLRIHRTSFKDYLSRPFAVIDIGLIVTGILRIILIVINYNYVSFKMSDLKVSENNKFISFSYADFWFFLQECVGAVLMCISYSQFLRFLSYKVVFYQIQKTFGKCFREFADLIFQEMTLMIAFALVFYLILLNCSKPFSDFGGSLATLLCQSFVSYSYIDRTIISSHMILAPVFLFLFFLMISVFFVNVFLAIICLYFRKVRQISLNERYQFYKYLTFALVYWRYNDIIHYKERAVVEEDSNDNPFATLRLRGGGNRVSRKCKLKGVVSDRVDEEFPKMHFKDFVTEKSYDTTQYLDLLAEREAALRYLTIYHMSDDPRVKSIFREFSLSALFYVLTTDNGVSMSEPRYFFVVKESCKEVYENSVFANMRKAVEEYAKEAGLVKDECFDPDEIPSCELLTVLDEKLCLLLNKSVSK